MKSRIALVGAMAAALAVAAAGCGSSSNNSSAGTSNLKPQHGGTIVFALPPQTNINWYIPVVNSGYDSLYNFQLINSLYKPLIWINNQYGINWKSSVASKITYNTSGTVYHVFMNPKWKWSNGQPVTTKDVLFTWNVIQATSAKNAPSPWPWVGAGSGDMPNGVKSVVANSKYEFTVTLKQPANQEWYIYNGLSALSPMPSAAWNKYPNNITQEIKYLGQNGTNPHFDTVVDGAYKLQSATSSQSWTIVPNPSFPGQKAHAKIVFAYQGSNASEFAALKTGTVQVGYVDLSEWGARGELTGDNLFTNYPFDYQDIELNMHSNAQGGLGPVFNQLYVRQALEMAINQNAINKAVYHGVGPAQYGPIPTVPKTIYLDPKLTKPIYAYNLKKAKALLTSHGWKEKGGVMTNSKGQKLAFTLMYSSGNASTDAQMALIQQEWGQIGVKITLKPTPFASLIGIIDSNANAPKWDAAGGLGIIYGGSYPTGHTLFGTGGGLNQFGYSSPKENALITATHKPWPNQQVNLQHFFAYEYYTSQQLPNLWVNQVGTINAVAKNVHNVAQYSNALTGYPLMNYWWIGK